MRDLDSRFFLFLKLDYLIQYHFNNSLSACLITSVFLKAKKSFI